MYAYSTHMIPEVPALSFFQFKGTESVICCYRNPSVETLPLFKEIYGVNTYVTSITHLDQLYYTKLKTNELGIDYQNILFIDSPKVIIKEQEYQKEKIAQEIRELYYKIKNEKRTVLIQSAGGSFKTGIIAYCLLRLSGEQRDEALKILLMLRNEKRNGFGDLRIEYAEKKIVPLLIDNELL